MDNFVDITLRIQTTEIKGGYTIKRRKSKYNKLTCDTPYV
jgi:hypothetical protein